MPGMHPHIDPEGLLEFSVVYTDRALNHMSKRFQGVMRDISSTLKQVYHARSAVWCRAAARLAWRPWPASSPTASRCWWCATAGSATAGARSSTWAASPPARRCSRPGPPAPARRTPGPRHPSRRWRPPSRAASRPWLCAPHVETSSGMLLPDDYLKRCGRRHPCRGRAVCAGLHRLGLPVGGHGRAGRGPAGQRAAEGLERLARLRLRDAERGRARPHRQHHQFQLRLRPEEVAADHGGLRGRWPRVPHHRAHRRPGPQPRRDGRERGLRV